MSILPKTCLAQQRRTTPNLPHNTPLVAAARRPDASRPELARVSRPNFRCDALVRSARGEGKDITVTAESGDVTLEGTVHFPYERRQASAAAWSAPGVTGLRNRLVVI